VTYLAFRDEWSIVYDRAELKDRGVVTNYTEHLADSSEEIALQRAWGRVQLGLDLASRWIAAEKKQPLLRIETKPKKVFALAHVEPYGLYLLPHSTSYAYDSKTNGKSFVVDPLWIDSQQRAGSKVVYIKPCFSTDKFAEPFWAVRRVEHSSAEADAANMVVVSVKKRLFDSHGRIHFWFVASPCGSAVNHNLGNREHGTFERRRRVVVGRRFCFEEREEDSVCNVVDVGPVVCLWSVFPLTVNRARLQVSRARPRVNRARPQVNRARPQVNRARPQVNRARPQVNRVWPQVNRARPRVNRARSPRVNRARPPRVNRG
jgi:hypothetical protein